jgi:hypothetical protein
MFRLPQSEQFTLIIVLPCVVSLGCCVVLGTVLTEETAVTVGLARGNEGVGVRFITLTDFPVLIGKRRRPGVRTEEECRLLLDIHQSLPFFQLNFAQRNHMTLCTN